MLPYTTYNSIITYRRANVHCDLKSSEKPINKVSQNLFDCQLSNEFYICHYYFQNVLYNIEKVKSNFRGQIS